LHRTGAMRPRVVRPSAALLAAQRDVSQLIVKWDDRLAARVAADNLFLDEPAARRAARFRELGEKHGACRPAVDTIDAENALRGGWRMPCERGWLDVFVTLAPTSRPLVQFLGVQSVLPPGEEMNRMVESVLRLMSGWDKGAAESMAAPGLDVERMRRQVAAASSSWGTCKAGEAVGGDGRRDGAVKLSCERGTLVVRLSLDPATRRLTSLNIAPTREERCVP
ncbi:MAG: hypothetical protein ACRD68_01890, partial [Pyrinomonadaceae bacterium]